MIFKIIFIAIGVAIFIFGVIKQKSISSKMKSGDFKEVNSKCIDFEESRSIDENGFDTVSYIPIYEYVVEDKKYTYKGTIGTPSRKGLGKEKVLLYNTKNHSEAISPNDKSGIILCVTGLIFIVLGIASLVVK